MLFRKIVFLLGLFLSLPAFANPACVVCTVAIGASLSIAEKLGVDNCVVGVWSGAMLAVLGFWAIRFFEKRNWNFKGRDTLLMVLSVGMIGFMYMGQLVYNPMIIGFLYIDSFLLANILGALTFIFGMSFYQWLKEKNGGHAHFPFEKVVLPFTLVLILSLLFHYVPICNCGMDQMTPVL